MMLDPIPAQTRPTAMIEENAFKRGLATLVDLFLVNGLVGYLLLPGLRTVGAQWPNMDAEVLILVSGVYFIGLWIATGQTIGKKLFGLRVIQMSGYPINFISAIVRYFGYAVLVFLFFLGPYFIGFIYLSVVLAMVDGLFILSMQRHQALHDILARTLVIKAR